MRELGVAAVCDRRHRLFRHGHLGRAASLRTNRREPARISQRRDTGIAGVAGSILPGLLQAPGIVALQDGLSSLWVLCVLLRVRVKRVKGGTLAGSIKGRPFAHRLFDFQAGPARSVHVLHTGPVHGTRLAPFPQAKLPRTRIENIQSRISRAVPTFSFRSSIK